MGYEELKIEGRNAVLEAFRSGKTIDKLFVLDGCQDGPVRTIVREAKKHDTIVHFVEKERLDQLSETKKHQGVIAVAAAYEYAEVEDMLKLAEEKGEPPFLFILDNIEDPHNLGAIIRTANLAGAHGVIIPKRRGPTEAKRYSFPLSVPAEFPHRPECTALFRESPWSPLRNRVTWRYSR